MSISTKDIPTSGGGVPKTLQPGNTSIKINSMYLEKFPFEEGAYNLYLNCEGADLGESFEGFFIDRNNEALGRHNGQVGRVRAAQWPYRDAVVNDSKILRDVEIAKFLKNLSVAVDCLDWYEAEDGKHETIESLVMHMNEQAPFKDVYLNVCLGGKEYTNKQGYINYDLFLPKFSKQGIPFESGTTDAAASRVSKFDPTKHIVVKKVKEVESFTAASATSSGSGFELGEPTGTPAPAATDDKAEDDLPF